MNFKIPQYYPLPALHEQMIQNEKKSYYVPAYVEYAMKIDPQKSKMNFTFLWQKLTAIYYKAV